MSSDEEQQTVNLDDDDADFQLNPFDHQSDQSEGNNEEQDSTQGELEQSGENFINKLAKNGDEGEGENDTQNENETAPEDGQDENNDQKVEPDEGDNQEDDKKIDDNLKETGEKLIGKLIGENDKQNDKETAPDEENNQQNENETAPDGDNDQQNENETAPDNEDDQNNENETTPDNDDDDEKDKKSGKGSKKSNNSGRAEKASQNMINQLIGGEDEHQTADGFHSKSNDDGEKSDTEKEKEKSDDSDDEKEKSDNSDDEKEKSDNSDDEKEKSDNSDDEKEKSDNSDDEKEKDKSDNKSEKDEKEETPDESLDDDFDEEGNGDDPSMMITEASNVIKPPKSPKQHSARRKPSLPPQPNYSDDEIMEQIKIMMKEKKLPDTSYHQPIRNYISREQLEASEQHDYQRAELLESYLDMLTDLLNQVDNSEQEEERRKCIEEKIQKVNESHQEFVRKWNKEWNDKTQEQEKTKKSMEERQELEINAFKNRCKEESFIQKFNKPSQTLINLRKAENQMAMSKLFDRAKALKKKADELQKVEQMEAQKKMNDNVLYQYQLIESRHEHERDCFEQHNRSIFETLEKKRDKEQRSYEMAISMLKAQLDPPPNKDRVEVIKPQTAKRPIRNNRTIKNIRTPAALEIQSVDFSKFTKTRKIIKPTTASGTSRRSVKK